MKYKAFKQKILFIGNYTDDDTYNLIINRGVRDLSQASRLFQERLILHMNENCENFQVLSILPIAEEIEISKQTRVKNLNILNIGVKQDNIFSCLQAMTEIEALLKNFFVDTTMVHVIMYAINPIALIPLLKLKKSNNLKLTTICSELPQFRRYKKNLKNGVKRQIFAMLNRNFDKYILFAESMRDYIPSKKEWMVLEGFAPEKVYEPIKKDKNIAMYAGGLAADNGIQLMIDVANKSQHLDELWICGNGECLELVKKNVNKKIKYLGQLNNNEVVELERRAKVLLNLRNPNNSLTKFSFPSKVMEYMASGTIVLSTKLKGISKEYYQYIYSVDDYTVEGIVTQLDRIFKMEMQEYFSFAKRATDFIEMKSAKNKISKIIEFIND